MGGIAQQRVIPDTESAYVSWQGKSVDFSHGKLLVSENGRFITHADGTPFFYLGDTAWELFHRLNRDEAERYLENRREKGFSVIQSVMLAELDGLNTPAANGELPLIDHDPEKPNEAYFAWVDTIIRLAGQKGLYMALLPTWGDKVDTQWGIGPVVFNRQNAKIYGRYLANRYKDFPNIIWIIGGDRNGGGDNTPVWHALAEGIKSIDRNHLMTFHPFGEHTSGQWFHEAGWLDFNGSQTGHAACSFEIFDRLIVADYNRLPVKPCINLEPNYEDHPVRGNNCTTITWFDDSNCRQALYWSLFSGAAGHTYGSHPVWQFMSPSHNPEGGVRNNWYDVLDLPGAGNMIHARRLMEAYDFYSRVPAPELILTPQPDALDMAVAAKGKGYAFVYLPNGNTVEVSLEGISRSPVLELKWFNPRTGEYLPIGKVPAKGSRQATPPSSGKGHDWILVLLD
ncbi:MAG: glycoside hydrolase family 140 protein [Tannerellaceae bacterium]|nr:glycoside hydrolase family 140 protein [Tannerellaceae bacterium]